MSLQLLIINPGSTSTKLSVFKDREEVWTESINHSGEELANFEKLIDQLDWREGLIREKLKQIGMEIAQFDAIVARGGAGLDPITGGTYLVDKAMLEDLYQGKNAEHASNLAGIIAHNLAKGHDIAVYTVDPVSVDEFEPLARLSGLPEFPRRCQSHTLNLKAIARKTAETLGSPDMDINLIGVHLGGGISVAALKKGKIVDVNNANQDGPYSPERAGSLPVYDLVDYIYKHQPEERSFKKRLVGKGGLLAYLGTSDGREIEKRIAAGDHQARLVYDGLIYQVGKEVGAMASVLKGDVQGIFLTGGLAHSAYVVSGIKERISYLAPILVFPGNEEMRHLAEGALRVLEGKEKPKKYREEIVDTEIITCGFNRGEGNA